MKPAQFFQVIQMFVSDSRPRQPSGITAAEYEPPTINQEFTSTDQSGSFFNRRLGARKQVIIECHSGPHVYLQSQNNIITIII